MAASTKARGRADGHDIDLRGELHQSWGVAVGAWDRADPVRRPDPDYPARRGHRISDGGKIWIAAALLVVSVLQLFHGWRTTAWSGRIWQIFGGPVFIAAGILMFVYPTLGLLSVTMIVATALVAQGIASLLVGASFKGWSGRRWLIISAIVSIIAGLLILFDLPTSAGWTLVTIVGVALVLQGVSLTLLSLDVRRAGAAGS